MTVKLRISENLALPVDAVTQRISILGRTRSGKSHTAGVLVEEVLKARQQVVILDPKGDWWGLRSSANGKSAGLQITIMGGKHGDIPLEPTAGALVADVVINEGISVVLDLSFFESKADEVRFVTAFLDRLYRKNSKPVLLVIDESDTFAPQRPERNETVMLNRMETICRRGAGRGIGVILVSQRSASLHKGCLSQTELMIAHQTTAPQDRKAIELWVVDHGDEEQRESFMQRVPKLPIGTAIVWSPSWLEIYKEVGIRQKDTYDSSATPRVGKRRRPPKVLAQVDLERLKKHMTATIEKAKQEDPKALRAEIQKLRAELAAKPQPSPVRPVKTSIQVKERIVEVPVLKKRALKHLQKLVEQLDKAKSHLGFTSQSVEIAARSLESSIGRILDREDVSVARKSVGLPPIKTVSKSAKPAAKTTHSDENGSDPSLLAGERRMLEVLAQFHPGSRTRSQLGALSGYTPSGGTFGNYFGKLRRLGLIREGADLSITITDEGLESFGGRLPKGPQSTDDLLEMWRGKLLAGERKMLDVLIEAYPKAVTRQELGERTGYESTGGTFGNYLGTLRRNALAAVKGDTVTASESLFEAAS